MEEILGHTMAPDLRKLGAAPKRGIKGSVAPHVGKATAQGALCSREDGALVGPQSGARCAISIMSATAGNRLSWNGLKPASKITDIGSR